MVIFSVLAALLVIGVTAQPLVTPDGGVCKSRCQLAGSEVSVDLQFANHTHFQLSFLPVVALDHSLPSADDMSHALH